MNKQEFLLQLGKGLSGLPQEDIEGHLHFYSEMIDDRMEEGFSEEDAVLAIGSIDEIVAQLIADIPFTKIENEKIKPKRKLKVWEIVLLALGSPIWISLLIAAAAVILSLYVTLWSVIASLWAVFVSFIACAIGGLIIGTGFAFANNKLTGIAIIGAGIVLTGLSIFMFYGCKFTTKGILLLTKKLIFSVKSCFINREETQ